MKRSIPIQILQRQRIPSSATIRQCLVGRHEHFPDGGAFSRIHTRSVSISTISRRQRNFSSRSLAASSTSSHSEAVLSARLFSDSSLATTPSHRRSMLQQSTARLLEAPVGSLDDQLWSEAYYTILGWMEPPSSSSSKESGDFVAQRLLHSFRLLDRLAQEESAMMARENNNNNGEDSSTLLPKAVPGFFQTGFLNLVLNHWRKNIDIASEESGLPPQEALELRPRQVLQRVYRYQESSTRLQPDIQSFGIILDAISSLVTVSSSVSENKRMPSVVDDDPMMVVDEIMERLVATARSPVAAEETQLSVRPNVVVFSSAMNAWVKSGRREAPTKVEEILEQMKSLKDEFPDWKDIAPNQYTYSTAIDALSKVGNAEKVQGLLREMYQVSSDTDDPTLKPGILVFTGYLVALSKQGRMEEAENMLYRMEELYESGELDEPPNVVSYSTVLDGYARSTTPGASIRAEALLNRMLDKYQEGDGSVAPNAVSFNSIILSHMKSGNIQAAESLLQRMHTEYLRSGNKDIRPTMETYSTLLSGLARSRRRDAGERAEKLLDLVKNMARSGDLDKTPDVVLYNTVLDCWAKSFTPESPDRAKNILDTMVQDGITPDVVSFNSVIHCMANSNKLEEAERMLQEMERVGVHANSITYNTLLSAYVAAVSSKKKERYFEREKVKLSHRVDRLFDRLKQDPRVPVDVITYNTVLSFFSRAGDVEKASALLEEMLAQQSAVSPDILSMNTVISAWANSGRLDAPERAEAIFERILLREDHNHNILPTSVTFNVVMNAWTKSRRPEAAERCQHLFELMKLDYDEGMRPDHVTFNILIHAWSLSNDDAAPDRAELVHDEMNCLYKEGDIQMRPTSRTFGALISVWSKSKRANAGEMAQSYLRKIVQNAEERRYTRETPRVHEFTSAIRAWEKSGDPRAPYKADEILYLLLQQVEKGNKHAQPDQRFFGAFLSTLSSSRVPNKGFYANRVVQMMKKFKIRPNTYLLELLKRCHGIKTAGVDTTRRFQATTLE